jgi:hypothetical protein
MKIVIRNGVVRFVYDDQVFAALKRLGPAKITRASHVEPHPEGGWIADMSPLGGPVLFANGPAPTDFSYRVADWKPFATRSEALTAERKWIEDRLEGL